MQHAGWCSFVLHHWSLGGSWLTAECWGKLWCGGLCRDARSLHTWLRWNWQVLTVSTVQQSIGLWKKYLSSAASYWLTQTLTIISKVEDFQVVASHLSANAECHFHWLKMSNTLTADQFSFYFDLVVNSIAYLCLFLFHQLWTQWHVFSLSLSLCSYR